MNVQTLEIDPQEAREKLKAYRGRCHKDAEDVYRAAERLYEAAGRGKRLIVAGEAILSGGFDNLLRPRLAIARADRRETRLELRSHGFTFDSSNTARECPSLKHQYSFPANIKREYRWATWYATVPMVPPEARPKIGQLKQWHILWEVDQWLDRPTINPPRDPILLEHVEADVYAIISQWDLTDIEREAMKLALS